MIYWIAFIPVFIVLLFTPVTGKRRKKGRETFRKNQKGPYGLPPGFLWGSATSSQQIESQQKSDWTDFEKKVLQKKRFSTLGQGRPMPGHIHALGKYSKEVIKKKTDYDERFAKDLAMAKKLAQNAYRFSVDWSRFFPKATGTKPAKTGIDFYSRILDACKKNSLAPSITLFHFSTPAWLWAKGNKEKGWENEQTIDQFAELAYTLAHNFGDQVTHWCTLNEPVVYMYNGYLDGIYPPNEQRAGPREVNRLGINLLRGHSLAYKILKENARGRKIENHVGISQHIRAFEPYRNISPLDRITAALIDHAFIWDMFDALESGVFKPKMGGDTIAVDGLAGSQDYIGLNYYGRYFVKTNLKAPSKFDILMNDPKDPNEKTNQLGWSLYPRGLYDVIAKAHKRYQKPIYILENGTPDDADDDLFRQDFLVNHLKEVHHAIEEHGADVRGYFHWSLIDNFEWAEGFEPRFGLVKIDYENNFKRTPRQSAMLYQEIIEAGGVTEAVWQYYKALAKKV